MFYKPGDSYYKEFTTSDPTSGAARNADSTPVATANHNGIDDSTFVLTVTNIDTGRYKITGTVPAGYAAGDVVNTSIAATVNSVAGKIAIDTFMVDTKRVSNLNDIASSSIVSGGAIATSSGAVSNVTTVTNSVTSNVTQWAGSTVSGTPPTTSAIASATASAILATPANLLATDSSGRVILQPTQTGVTIPNVTTVTNAVTAGTVSDKSGYSLATAPPTASAIASATAAEILATPANLLATDSSGRVQVQYGTAAGQVNLSGGNLAGAVPSVTGSIGGSVGSVTGTVGSVTGSVGSVAGNVGGNVLGSVNSVSYPVTIATGSISSSTFAAITAGTTGFLERLALLIHRFYPSGSGKIIQPTTVAPSGSECITYGPDGMTIIASQDISDDGTTQMIGYTQ